MAGLVAALATTAPFALGARDTRYPPQCGGRVTEDAHKDLGRGRAPLAIGDSVMLLAVDNLANKGYRVDAQGCRSFQDALNVLEEERGRLPHLVVLELGADYGISVSQVRKAIDIIGRKHHEPRLLGLVTPRELGGGSGEDADNVRKAGEKFKHRVIVLDWVKKSEGNPGWFQPDGLHLTYSGADAFARLLKKALPKAPW
jgi:hypothetical protein